VSLEYKQDVLGDINRDWIIQCYCIWTVAFGPLCQLAYHLSP
jgi:hypothetical protein